MGCGRVECVGTMIIISQPSIHYIKELLKAGQRLNYKIEIEAVTLQLQAKFMTFKTNK